MPLAAPIGTRRAIVRRTTNTMDITRPASRTLTAAGRNYKPLARGAGARQRLAQVTLTRIV
jgi:hypothetical protein